MGDASKQDSDRDARKYRYDPAFEDAVESGSLTARQAMQRGRREACAAGLASRHRLPMELAYRVADNSLSLLEALRQRTGSVSEPVRLGAPAESSRVRRRITVALLSLLGLALLWAVLPRMTEVRSRNQATPVEVSRDSRGRILQVTGPDPDSVLSAYCESWHSDGALESLGLMPSARSAPKIRLGLLRNRSDAEELLAIPIRKDNSTQLWTAGDGRGLLLAMQAPDSASRSFGNGDSN